MIPVPNVKLSIGEQQVGEPQTYHLAGPIEGPWWVRYSWWVISLGSFWLLGSTLAAIFFAATTFWFVTNSQRSAIEPPPTASSATTVAVEIDRLASTSAVEKLTDSKPSTAVATATSTTESTTKMVSLPMVIVKVPEHLTLEVKGLTPSPQAQVEPILTTTDPTTKMTPAERRQYEIWVERR